MIGLTTATILSFIALLVLCPSPIYALEPFVIDDFEGGIGAWSTSQGAGAPSGGIEESEDAHDGKAARISFRLPIGEVNHRDCPQSDLTVSCIENIPNTIPYIHARPTNPIAVELIRTDPQSR